MRSKCESKRGRGSRRGKEKEGEEMMGEEERERGEEGEEEGREGGG